MKSHGLFRAGLVSLTVSMAVMLSGCSSPSGSKANNSAPSAFTQIRKVSDVKSILKFGGSHLSDQRKVSLRHAITQNFTMIENRYFPPSAIRFINKNSHHPISLPKSLPLFPQPNPGRYQLAANIEITSHGYGIDLFWKPYGSHASHFAMDSYVGIIEVTDGPNIREKYALNPHVALDGFMHWKKIRLLGHVHANESTFHNADGLNNAITWSKSGWKFMIADEGTGKASAFVNVIQDFEAAHHGIIAPDSTTGYVVVQWFNTGGPYCRVAWERRDKYWYVVSLPTLQETLTTSYSMATNIHAGAQA